MTEPSELEKIAAKLAPEKVAEAEQPHDEAREKYSLSKFKIEDYGAFRKELIEYIKHHHKEVYNADIDDVRAFSEARRILEAALRDQGGFIGAFDLAKDGKMKQVLDVLAGSMRGQAGRDYTTHVISEVDPTDLDKHTNLAQTYINMYKGQLPGVETYSAQQLAKDWDTFAQSHAEALHRYKKQLAKK
jgi:hypothetical protein